MSIKVYDVAGQHYTTGNCMFYDVQDIDFS